ncbi:Ig-like domain-containing protein [Runella limosa]|uniref:Ig-like domain-containing protein n=1 Tax=Runella limosa TaxID=370978 RepID=UPI0004149A4A|nr:Ig-like domain-containing protein [Runella limosa]
MKALQTFIFVLSLFCIVKGNAQDMGINILNQPASVSQGATNGRIIIDICNFDGGTTNSPLNKIQPLISLPSALVDTFVTAISFDGWSIVSKSGSTIRFQNTVSIAPGECKQIVLGYKGVNVGGPLTVTGTIQFSGPQTSGNNPANDNSTTSITVTNAPIDTDGDGIPDTTDLDDDNDGILDTVENAAVCSTVLFNGVANADCDGDGIPNQLDLDSDNDGLNDVNEAGGTDANGDGFADGTPDAITGIPASAGNGITPSNTDGTGGSDPYDLDSDNDGQTDLAEGGLNASILDPDGDGIVNCAANCDPDKDGILEPVDGLPAAYGDAITNRPPVANNDTYSILQGAVLTNNVLTNDTDPDNNTLTVSTTPTVAPTHGTVVLQANGAFTYTPTSATFTGQDSFCYLVCDNGTPSLCKTACATINIGAGTVDLSISKVLVGSKIRSLNDTITYRIVVKNSGNIAATNIVVKDSTTTGLQIISGTPTSGSFSGTNWTIPSLASGDSTTLVVKAKVIAEGVNFNFALIKSADQPDTVITNDTANDCITVPIGLCSGQSVEASVPSTYTNVIWFKNGAQVASGNVVLFSEEGTYTFTASNTTCPANGCCPLIIQSGTNCCPVQLCIPVTVVKRKK